MIDRHRTKGFQTTVASFLAIIVIIAIITRSIDINIVTGSKFLKKFVLTETPQIYSSEFDCSLNCSDISAVPHTIHSPPSTTSCPDYFRWIHEDLKPWKKTGITCDMVEKGKNVSHIRIVILNGRLYTEKYKEVFQTRDVVTIWGILQLIRLYPGKVPDLDLMFECDDKPVVSKSEYGKSKGSLPPPPVFHYCGDKSSFDIVFPDWSFWGWPELNIKPWDILKEELEQGNSKVKWRDREPYAFWKGNAELGHARHNLAKCNVSDAQDWNARIYNMAWKQEKKQGFNTSDLASQCTYRYKIYVEGHSWSVSQKYILACNSTSLIIAPHYYDFFSRSLEPTIHYWPINETDICPSIKFAVGWGNKHVDKAQEIGKEGSRFVQDQLKMKHVYDYIFHLLTEYAKLLKYKPTVPKGAVEVCSETLICSVKGAKKKFRIYSMVKSPSDFPPCNMPAAYQSREIHDLVERRKKLTKKVKMWQENENI